LKMAMDKEFLMDLDRHILRLLKKRGSNFRKTHSVEFYVYCKTKAAARRVGIRVRKEGFHVALMSDRSAKRWVCLPIKEMFPRLKDIRSAKKLLNRLAKPFGGYCDGWGTQVEK
jgi:hypothetical protein